VPAITSALSAVPVLLSPDAMLDLARFLSHRVER
jgi:hypothetical protein